jgi:hypothetical protein
MSECSPNEAVRASINPTGKSFLEEVGTYRTGTVGSTIIKQWQQNGAPYWYGKYPALGYKQLQALESQYWDGEMD